MFERLRREKDVDFGATADELKTNTHRSRKLLVTHGLKAGASDLDIARWQNRAHLGDIATYDQRSHSERLESIKSAIRAGKAGGEVTQMYFQLAEDERDVWLDAQLQAAHITPMGFCVHDFSVKPCPHALNCLRGCRDFLVTKENIPALEKQREQTLKLAEVTKKEALKNPGKYVARWVEDVGALSANLDVVLDAAKKADLGVSAPFAAGVSFYKPIASG